LAGNLAKMLQSRSTFKRPLGRPRRRFEDSATRDFKEIATNTRSRVDADQDRDLLEIPCECGVELSGSISL
jgi:hypothetical protein